MSSTMTSVCGSRTTAFRGSQVGTRRAATLSKGATGAVMMKKGIHPEWFAEARVVCNGVEVMTVGGTKPVYNVDIYSGNHPFYQGNKSMMVVDEGRLNRFKKRFADAGLEVGAAASIPGKAVDEDGPKTKAVKGKGGKKK